MEIFKIFKISDIIKQGSIGITITIDKGNRRFSRSYRSNHNHSRTDFLDGFLHFTPQNDKRGIKADNCTSVPETTRDRYGVKGITSGTSQQQIRVAKNPPLVAIVDLCRGVRAKVSTDLQKTPFPLLKIFNRQPNGESIDFS